jgi:hypothetical protein
LRSTPTLDQIPELADAGFAFASQIIDQSFQASQLEPSANHQRLGDAVQLTNFQDGGEIEHRPRHIGGANRADGYQMPALQI